MSSMSPRIQPSVLTIEELRGLSGEGRLWAVMDGCDAPEVREKAGELGEERAVSLYRGSAEEDLETIAPFLFAADTALVDWILATEAGKPWGIYVLHPGGLDAVRQHLRRFLVVESPEGEQWYFRFYDPRVLDEFLPTCDEGQAAELFGAVEGYGLPGPEADQVTLLKLVPESDRHKPPGPPSKRR